MLFIIRIYLIYIIIIKKFIIISNEMILKSPTRVSGLGSSEVSDASSLVLFMLFSFTIISN